eukprot:6572654-Karenia_brevis.AAC.1
MTFHGVHWPLSASTKRRQQRQRSAAARLAAGTAAGDLAAGEHNADLKAVHDGSPGGYPLSGQ